MSVKISGQITHVGPRVPSHRACTCTCRGVRIVELLINFFPQTMRRVVRKLVVHHRRRFAGPVKLCLAGLQGDTKPVRLVQNRNTPIECWR